MRTFRIAAAGLAAMLVASAGTADAQTRVGAKVGINLAEQSLGTDFGSVSTDGRTGVVAGAFVHRPIGAPFFVRPEVLCSERPSRSRTARSGRWSSRDRRSASS